MIDDGGGGVMSYYSFSFPSLLSLLLFFSLVFSMSLDSFFSFLVVGLRQQYHWA